MAENPSSLRRVLTFWPLLLNGLGVIVGAGIYVAIGSVIGRAGDSAPLAFLLAGVTAAMTGLCYAELVSRFPEAAGSVAYVRHGFGSDALARLTGIALTTVVAVSAASIAQGAVTYLAILLPWPSALLLPLLIIACAAIAAYGIGESVGIAAAIGVLEIAGLIAASVVGLIWAPVLHLPAILPADLPAWQSTLSGAFIAFFAYIGFETLANLAEETKDPDRTVPRGIVGAIVISIVLYVTVATAAVLSGTSSQRPLLDIFPGGSAWLFAWVGFLAVANGVLVQIVMLARLFYGMASRSQIPPLFAHVSARTATPLRATALATAIVMVAAILVPFEQLLVLNNAVTLGIFILVDIALWRVQRTVEPRATGFTVPRWVPPIAALLAGALLLAEVVAIAV